MLILKNVKTLIFLILLFLFSSFGSLLVYKTVEVFGPFFTTDSVAYVQAAENFKNGHGVSIGDADGFKILIYFPPLYPVILSFFLDNFKLLNSILAFITLFIFGYIIFDATGSIITSILSVILFSLSPIYLYIFSHILSETLSFPFVLLTIFLIKKYLDRPSLFLLILFSIFISISTLIRYANLFFILLIVLIFLIYRIKITQLILSVIISSSGFIFWSFIAYFFPNTTGPPRGFILHLFTVRHLSNLIETLYYYILPGQYVYYWHNVRIPLTLIIIVGISLGTLLLILSTRKTKGIFSNWERILISASISYLLFLFISISIADFFVLNGFFRDNMRNLSPFFIFILAFLFIFLYKVPKFKLGGLIIYFTMILAYLPYTKDFVKLLRKGPPRGSYHHYAFFSKCSNLQIMGEVRKLPQGAYIYSNAPDLIYLHTKRFASIIPLRFYPQDNMTLPNFQDRIKEMAAKLKERDGFLVMINPPCNWMTYWYKLPNETELNSLIDLVVYKITQDGVIYKVRPMSDF
jgi:hypothetical protein